MNFPWISLGPVIAVIGVLAVLALRFRTVYRQKGREKEVEERHASKFVGRWAREYWFWITDPIVRLFILLKLTPNWLTVAGVLISVVSGYFFAVGEFGLAGWIMIFAATFDMFDGRVARATHQETRSGAYFDAVMDRVSEGVVFVGLALYYQNNPLVLVLLFLTLIGSYMVSYARAKGEAMNAVYHGGTMQRPERIVYLGLGAVFAPLITWFIRQGYPDFYFDLYLIPLAFVGLMTWVTSIDRIRHVMKLLDFGPPS